MAMGNGLLLRTIEEHGGINVHIVLVALIAVGFAVVKGENQTDARRLAPCGGRVRNVKMRDATLPEGSPC